MKVGQLGLMESDLAILIEELVRLGSKMDDFKIGGVKVSKIEGLQGKTAQELSKLSGQELLELGVKDGAAIREFVQYQKMLQIRDALQIQLLTSKQFVDLAKLAPELIEIRKLKGEALEQFVSKFNQNHPEGFQNKALKVLTSDSEQVIAFDEAGRLKAYSHSEWVEATETLKVAHEKLLQRPGVRGTLDQNLYRLREEAKLSNGILKDVMDEVAGKSNGHVKQGTIKGMERSRFKATTDYLGNTNEVTDLIRGTIVYDSLDDLYRGIDALKESDGVKQIRIKDRVGNPLGEPPLGMGYRDMLLNVRLKNGHVAEIQLHIKQMNIAKETGLVLPKAVLEEAGFASFTEAEVSLGEAIMKEAGKPGKGRLPLGEEIASTEIKGHSLYEISRRIDPKVETSTARLALKKKVDILARLTYDYAWNQFLQDTGYSAALAAK